MVKDFGGNWEAFFDEKAKQFKGEAKALGYRSDRNYYFRRDAVISSLKEIFNPLTDKRILDVGCGNGLYSKPLNEKNTVFGIDISQEMLKVAKGGGVKGAKGSVLSLPFKNDYFDLVISAGVAQHLDGIHDLILECARVTKPGGGVLIETLNIEYIVRRGYNLFKKEVEKFYKAEDVWKTMEEGGIKGDAVIFLYYPLIYKRRVSKKIGVFDRLFSSTFAVVGIKE